MKPLICFYCDGSEAKLAVITKEKEEISVLKVASITTANTMESSPSLGQETALEIDSSGDSISFDALDDSSGVIDDDSVDMSEVSMIANQLADINLAKAEFIPVVTEPVVNFHVYSGTTEKDKNKVKDAIIEDIERTKGMG